MGLVWVDENDDYCNRQPSHLALYGDYGNSLSLTYVYEDFQRKAMKHIFDKFCLCASSTVQ